METVLSIAQAIWLRSTCSFYVEKMVDIIQKKPSVVMCSRKVHGPDK